MSWKSWVILYMWAVSVYVTDNLPQIIFKYIPPPPPPPPNHYGHPIKAAYEYVSKTLPQIIPPKKSQGVPYKVRRCLYGQQIILQSMNTLVFYLKIDWSL